MDKQNEAKVYDIICGKCDGRTFKSIEGEYKCQDCGYVLSDEEIDNLLTQAYNDYVVTK